MWGFRVQGLGFRGLGFRHYPQGPSTQIAGFQGPKTTPSMDFGT